MPDENMRKYLKNLRYLALKTLTDECCTGTGKLFQIDTPEY